MGPVETAAPAAARRDPGRAPAGTKGVWVTRDARLVYRFVMDSPYTRAGANSLEGDTCWYAASIADSRERALQEAACKGRHAVIVTVNPGMRSGQHDQSHGEFRHTGRTKTVVVRRGQCLCYELKRV